jgi:hypothetical protein
VKCSCDLTAQRIGRIIESWFPFVVSDGKPEISDNDYTKREASPRNPLDHLPPRNSRLERSYIPEYPAWGPRIQEIVDSARISATIAIDMKISPLFTTPS